MPATLGLTYFSRQWRLFGIMFQSIKSPASIMFIFLILLSLALQFIIYEAGLVPSMYFEVLGRKDYDAFRSVVVYSMEIIIINALMKSSVQYLSQLLYVKWRGMLCSHIHTRYFAGISYYKLNVMESDLDNLDQRIVRDANMSCQGWSTLMSKLIVTPFTIVYYSYQCFINTTPLGPVMIYVYFIGGTIINRFLMSPVIRTTITREKREGDFRFQHLQVRVNAESIAFFHAGEIESYKSSERLRSLLAIQRALYGWSFCLNSVVNIFDYVGSILSYLIIAIPIFGGKYDDLAPEELSALISKNAFVCMYLIYSFSQLFDMARTVSDIAGHTHRLGELLEKMDEYEDHKDDNVAHKFVTVTPEVQGKRPYQDYFYDNEEFDEFEASDVVTELPGESSTKDAFIVLKNVTCTTPDGNKELLKNFSMSLVSGQNVLITGGNGSGKTSLFRLFCKIWHPSEGVVDLKCHTGRGGVMFLPHKPLCTDGTLKQLVTYPSMDGYRGYSLSTDDERVVEVLLAVGLAELIERVENLDQREEVNWADKLSPGEMQKMSFARLLYHEPRVAVMDEPTSALDVEVADSLFMLCKKRNITCITAGHNDSLLKHHDVRLHLNGDGTWHYYSLL